MSARHFFCFVLCFVYICVYTTLFIILIQFRSPSGVERHFDGNDTLATYCHARTFCHNYLRNHWSGVILRDPAQNLLQQCHR